MVQLYICPCPRVNDTPPIQNGLKNLNNFLNPYNESINRKYDKEKRLADLSRRMGPSPLCQESYKQLFDTLIERNRTYFTSEYGKTLLDFENYKKGKTDM